MRGDGAGCPHDVCRLDRVDQLAMHPQPVGAVTLGLLRPLGIAHRPVGVLTDHLHHREVNGTQHLVGVMAAIVRSIVAASDCARVAGGSVFMVER